MLEVSKITNHFIEFCFVFCPKRKEMAVYDFPHQNCVAETHWWTVRSITRCLSKQIHLHDSFCVRAINHAFYLTKSCLDTGLPRLTTPQVLICRRKLGLSIAKVFNCSTFWYLKVSMQELDSEAGWKNLCQKHSHQDSSLFFKTKLPVRLVSREISFSIK